MTTLTFTLQNGAYYTDSFSGDVAIQLGFPNNIAHVVAVETRLDNSLDWIENETHIIKEKGIFTIVGGADGQEYRLRCINEPSSAASADFKAPDQDSEENPDA